MKKIMYRFTQEVTLKNEKGFVTSVSCSEDKYDMIERRKAACISKSTPYKIYKDGSLIEEENFDA